MNHDAIINTLIGIVTDGDLFTREEAVSLLRSIVSETPEEMAVNAEKVITWARKTRERQAILDIILKLGMQRAIAVRPAANDDIEMSLTLHPDEIEIKP